MTTQVQPIRKDDRGHVALYRDVSDTDGVSVLAIRHQRESGDKRLP